MKIWLVTIKLPKNPEHDPHNKVTGNCPFSASCTDRTGEHHTGVAFTQEDIDNMREAYRHITRVEEVEL